VEHGRHGVDPKPVDVVAVQPVETGGEEEAADLVALVVEDAAAAVRLVALSPVGMLERCVPSK
jgi:hypothetical protein